MSQFIWLWIPFTVAAAVTQTMRNAMQRGLTASLGTLGATHVRFLFAFPFALAFFAIVLFVSGDRLSWPQIAFSFWPWLATGGMLQILATALMLAVMKQRSFVVTTAYLKTEPMQTAVFGFVFLGDHLSALNVCGIFIATVGVVITALRPGIVRGFGNLNSVILGVLAGSCLALSSIGYRGAILSVTGVSFVTAASLTLAATLPMQIIALSAWLTVRSPGTMTKIFREWRPSLFAGFLGTVTSLCWFLALALTAAANVRTLGLIEVLFAQGIAYYSMKQPILPRELAGIALIVTGVAILVAQSPG
jgi:drug/metabolite transporter (DMT)-like permease